MNELRQAYQIAFVIMVAVVIIFAELFNEIFLGWILTPARRKKDWNKRQVFFF